MTKFSSLTAPYIVILNGNVIVSEFSSLPAPQVFIFITYGTVNDGNFVKMVTFPFECRLYGSNF